MQTITMRTSLQYGVEITCLSQMRLPDSGNWAINLSASNVVNYRYPSAGQYWRIQENGIHVAIHNYSVNNLINFDAKTFSGLLLEKFHAPRDQRTHAIQNGFGLWKPTAVKE